MPWLIGGAADLAPSTKSNLTFEGAGSFEAGSYGGRNLHFGIREHAMGSICNGIALSGLRPYGSGFLIFSDYMKPPIRLAAIMELPVIYIFTHDSIGVGEDGPTHQPIEQLIALRAIPGMIVLRPADANEVAEAWRVAMQHRTTSRSRSRSAARRCRPSTAATTLRPPGVARGAYVLADCEGTPEVILIGTGSEVQLCVGRLRGAEGGGHPRPRRLDAELGAVREPGRGLSRERAAVRRHRPARGRAGRQHGLGPLCRTRRAR